MLQSIFTRPVFINPQAYLVIPELSLLHKCVPYDFSSNEYIFQVITTGQVEGKLIQAGDEYILHLDLYSDEGNVVLGEFYLDGDSVGDAGDFTLQQANGFVTLVFGEGGSGNISYPGLIAAWSAKGKSNDDEDRAILKDLTGNGHDITLNGFAFNTEGSGYGHPEYSDALVFDGVDDYGINENMPKVNDYTLIIKRNILGGNGIVSAFGKCAVATSATSYFWFEYIAQKNSYSFGASSKIDISSIPLISFQTKKSYNGVPINAKETVDIGDKSRFFISDLYKYKSPVNMAFYSAYLFDRSLDEQEIKSFIRKYIDPEYLLPSEQYLVLNQGKLNINKLK